MLICVLCGHCTVSSADFKHGWGSILRYSIHCYIASPYMWCEKLSEGCNGQLCMCVYILYGVFYLIAFYSHLYRIRSQSFMLSVCKFIVILRRRISGVRSWLIMANYVCVYLYYKSCPEKPALCPTCFVVNTYICE